MKHYKDLNGAFFGTEGEIPSGCTEVTIEEINASNLVTNENMFNALSYSEKRKLNYPSIQDQLDMQYWDSVNGTTTWADAIAAVKTEHPKP